VRQSDGYTFLPDLNRCQDCAYFLKFCGNLDFAHMPTKSRNDAQRIVWVVCDAFDPAEMIVDQ
jgi:hypothetical protein